MTDDFTGPIESKVFKLDDNFLNDGGCEHIKYNGEIKMGKIENGIKELIKGSTEDIITADDLAGSIITGVDKARVLAFDSSGKFEEEAELQNELMVEYMRLLDSNENLTPVFKDKVKTKIREIAFQLADTLKVMEDNVEESIALIETPVETSTMGKVLKYSSIAIALVGTAILAYKVYRKYNPAPVFIEIDNEDLMDMSLLDED